MGTVTHLHTQHKSLSKGFQVSNLCSMLWNLALAWLLDLKPMREVDGWPSTHNQQALALPFVWDAYWVNGKISWLSEKLHARVLAVTVGPEACLSVWGR